METSAVIHEIFSSLQGEGPYVGTPMTFVRFQGCALRCQWCDTPLGLPYKNGACRVETGPKSGTFRAVENPVCADRLNELLAPFQDAFVSLTGGEPLEQANFLARWLPCVYRHRRVLLETNGINAGALEKIVEFVHIISMDIKLRSSTNIQSCMKQHASFLKAAMCAGKQTCCKIVVTRDTSDAELAQAAEMIASVNQKIPVIIQPVSDTESFSGKPAREKVIGFLQIVGRRGLCAAVIPQMHKEWGIL